MAENKEKKAPAVKKTGGKKSKADTASFEVSDAKSSPATSIRLKEYYKGSVIPKLKADLAIDSTMAVPRLQKIVINCAVKDAIGNPKVLDFALADIAAITGQKPVITRAKKAIASFKVRKGNAVAVMVTLRRARMYEFLDRLVNVALPRVRDFKGVSPRAFDGRGNYSLGVREQIIFPEINYDKVDKVRGFTVTIVTSTEKNEHARALLTEFGMPFRK